MEEREKRPENETSLHQPDAKEESDSPFSPEVKESRSIVTGETATWNFSQEVEAHLQGEIGKSFTFADPATEEKQDESAVETGFSEEEGKTAEASESSKEQDEAKTEAEENKESEDLQEPVVAEGEEGKKGESGKQEEIPDEIKKETVAEKEEKIEEPKKETVAEQKEETNELEQEAQKEQENEPIQETETEEKSDELEKTDVLNIEDQEPKEEAAAEQKEETDEPEQRTEKEQESEPIRETEADEERDEPEKTAVLNIRDLRKEQPTEQKQSLNQEKTLKQPLFSAIRKKIIVVVAALLLAAASWIGVALATGEDGQSAGQIFGISPDQLIFKYGDKTFTFDLGDAGFDGKNPKTVNKQKLDAWIEEIRKQVERPARNANQERLGGPITPEKVGIKLDLNKLNQMLANFTALVNKPQKLPVIEIQPKVTKADLEKVDQYLIGSYSTSLGNSNPNRLNNIRLASKAINGLILMPGEKFSFNKVVGERTPERGYKKAGVIIKGEFSEGIGGGICQVSTTLFNSVDEAGLKILQRVSHSAQVTYVPAGRDATVSWGGPDFKFKNTLDKPIVIKIFIKHGRITVNVYTVPGTKVNHRYVPEA